MSLAELQRSWLERPPASAAVALEQARQAKAEILGLGGRRLVVATTDPTRVAKLAWKEEGLADNQLELRLWLAAGPELRELLCPAHEITAAGYLIQTRCLPIAFEAAGPAGAEICRILATHGVSDCAANLGLLLDTRTEEEQWRTVCYDYCLLRAELALELIGDEHRPARQHS